MALPLLTRPDPQIEQALGRLTLVFSELDCHISECLILLQEVQTEVEARRIHLCAFGRKAKQLYKALKARKDAGELGGLDTSTQFGPSLEELNEGRNKLVHAVFLSTFARTEKGYQTRFYTLDLHEGNTGFEANEPEYLDGSAIEKLARQIEHAAEQAHQISDQLVIKCHLGRRKSISNRPAT